MNKTVFFFFSSDYSLCVCFCSVCRHKNVLIICLFIYEILIHRNRAPFNRIFFYYSLFSAVEVQCQMVRFHWNGWFSIDKTYALFRVCLFFCLFAHKKELWVCVSLALSLYVCLFIVRLLMYVLCEFVMCEHTHIHDLLCVFYFRNKTKLKKGGMDISKSTYDFSMRIRLLYASLCLFVHIYSWLLAYEWVIHWTHNKEPHANTHTQAA